MNITAPPWIAMLQAHADQAEARTRSLTETATSLARDITNAAVEDVTGPRPASHRRDPLHPDTIAYLAERGITRHEWVEEHGHLTAWTGDECGCPDKRCIGHHHDTGTDCMCVTVLASEYLDERNAR